MSAAAGLAGAEGGVSAAAALAGLAGAEGGVSAAAALAGLAGAEGGVSAAAALAGLAGVCAVLAAWEAIAAAEQERLVRSAGRWLAPGLEALRSGRAPTSPERRRLVLVGALSLLGAGWLVAGLWAGLALGATAPWVARAVLRMRTRRRQAALAAGAPAVARALADALAGGHSVRGALAAVAGSGVPGPAGEELRTAAAALELGERTDDVLRALARRGGPGGALETLVAAILLQRDAGGDLSGLLRSLAGALEERDRTLAEARSATAQARFTARLVGGLPCLGVGLGELVQPGFVVGLATKPLPALLVTAAIALQVVALLWVRRISRVADLR